MTLSNQKCYFFFAQKRRTLLYEVPPFGRSFLTEIRADVVIGPYAEYIPRKLIPPLTKRNFYAILFQVHKG